MQSIRYLTDLVSKGDNPHIELKMYQSYPTWKLVLLDQYVWVQQYPPDKHVRSSPCRAYEDKKVKCDPNEIAPYDQFYTVFSRRWKSHYLGKFNFITEKLEFFDVKGKKIREESISERRFSERKCVSLKAERIFGELRDTVFIENISKSGMRIVTAFSEILTCNSGTAFELKLQLPSGEMPNLPCEVKWSYINQPHGLTNSIGVGIKDRHLNYNAFINTIK